ncbi:hypothetical protein D3C80_1959790 [compost metagenome]
MLGVEAGEGVELLRQLRQGIAHRQRQEVLGLLVARTAIQRLALQPGTHDPPDMLGFAAEGGELLLKIVDMHGARMLPRCAGAVKRSDLGGR